MDIMIFRAPQFFTNCNLVNLCIAFATVTADSIRHFFVWLFTWKTKWSGWKSIHNQLNVKICFTGDLWYVESFRNSPWPRQWAKSIKPNDKWKNKLNYKWIQSAMLIDYVSIKIKIEIKSIHVSIKCARLPRQSWHFYTHAQIVLSFANCFWSTSCSIDKLSRAVPVPGPWASGQFHI